MRDGVERSLGRADLTGASRFAIERLASELREAGSPATVAAPDRRLRELLPPVVTLADLDSGVPQSPGGAIQVASVPAAAPQGVLVATAAAGTVFLELDLTARCTSVGLACGFRPGASAVLFDSSHFAIVTIDSVADAGNVRVTSPIPSAFSAGAVSCDPRHHYGTGSGRTATGARASCGAVRARSSRCSITSWGSSLRQSDPMSSARHEVESVGCAWRPRLPPCAVPRATCSGERAPRRGHGNGFPTWNCARPSPCDRGRHDPRSRTSHGSPR